MRASITAEQVGVPSVSLVCEGFERQASATARGYGFDGLALGVLAGHVDAQSHEEMLNSFVSKTVPQIVEGLTTIVADAPGEQSDEPAATDVVATGGIDEINAFFRTRSWSDGLPIIPPTLQRVRRFLEPSGHDPWKQIGVAKTSGRDVTIWSIAVNAVMAGCVPEHLPVLIAAAQVLCDPGYGAEHSGNTTGADALMIVNGPCVNDLAINAGQGLMREGVHANTAIGRWLRLYLRNVFDFTSDQHDKATFGNSTRVVLAEDPNTLADLGWPSISAEFDFGPSEDVLTMARFNSGLIIGSVFGSTPEEILPYLGDGIARSSGWDLTHLYGLGQGHFRPLLVLSPVLARTFADAYWSKDQLREALYEHARIPAWRFEKLIGEWTNLTAGRRSLVQLVGEGHLPEAFAESEDPDRLVPVVTHPGKFMVAVAGDPNRTNAYVLSHDGPHGDWTAKPIDMTMSQDLVCEIPR